MKQKLQGLIYNAVEMKHFIVISLLKQALFLVTPIDIETKLFLDRSGRCNKPNLIFVASSSPKIQLIV